MKRQNDYGFTLIEVLTAAFILVIVSSIAAAGWSEFFAGKKLERAARQLAADIRLVQSEAITAGSPAGVTFYRSSEMYKLTFSDGSNRLVTLPEGIDLLTTNFTSVLDRDVLTFSSTGAPNAGTVHLSLTEEPYGDVYVIVAVATGRVRVSDLAPWQ